MHELTRRDFMKSGLSLIAAGSVVPSFVAHAADVGKATASGGPFAENVLVLVQLAGGNDGLNTVIPYADPLYREHRPRIAIGEEEVLKLDKAIGLHPSLTGLKTLFDAGNLAVVQGIGYPKPNRSHFIATDIFQTASPGSPQGTGWIGRVNDSNVDADRERMFAAVTMGGRLSGALKGGQVATPAIRSIDDFRMLGRERDAEQRRTDLDAFQKLQACDGQHLDRAPFLQEQMLEAYVSSENLKSTVGAYRTRVPYPNSGLGRQLKLVAQMIASPMQVRTFHASLGGFDTHSNQTKGHGELLEQLGEAIAAFQLDLEAMGQADRVLVMSYSEFGRRVKENGSRGTDHGSGQSMFLAGAPVKGGVMGTHPSLDMEALDRGDLKWHTDFRRVYANVLERWFGADSAAVLGAEFDSLPIV